MNTFMRFALPPEVAGDVISGENVKTIEGYAVLDFEVAADTMKNTAQEAASRTISEL